MYILGKSEKLKKAFLTPTSPAGFGSSIDPARKSLCLYDAFVVARCSFQQKKLSLMPAVKSMTTIKRRMQRDLPIAWINAPTQAFFVWSSRACAFSPRRGVKVRSLQGQRVGAVHLVGSAKDDSTSIAPLQWSTKEIDYQHLVNAVKFNEVGMVPAVAQQWDTGEVLMVAWMNADSIRETMKGGRAVYYSRSRKQLWRKGDTSGQIQMVHDVLLDCDGDTILLKVDQLGVACHTGRRSCFFTAYRPPDGKPTIVADVLMDPKDLYKADQKKQ